MFPQRFESRLDLLKITPIDPHVAFYLDLRSTYTLAMIGDANIWKEGEDSMDVNLRLLTFLASLVDIHL